MANKSQRIKISARNIYVTEARLPSVSLNNVQIPASNTAKYLGLYLDRKLKLETPYFYEEKSFEDPTVETSIFIDKKSPLTIENKLLIYTNIIKPMWS